MSNARTSSQVRGNPHTDELRTGHCGTAFCFLCGTDYGTIDKSGHAKGCTYAKPNRIDPLLRGLKHHGKGFREIGLSLPVPLVLGVRLVICRINVGVIMELTTRPTIHSPMQLTTAVLWYSTPGDAPTGQN